MSKLFVKFGNTALKEVLVGESGVRIGRSPINGIAIDNPAVSHHHARVFLEAGRLMIEDFGSLNGTFVNGQRVKTAMLKPGDSVAIGKHTILVEESHEMDGFLAWRPPSPADVAKINETVMLGTKERSDLLQRLAAAGESSAVASTRATVPTLVVRSGKTNQREYRLTDKLTVIGKSELATVKLKGWFAPKAAAQINRSENDSYYIGAAGRVPCVNGQRTSRPRKLVTGDIIDVAGIRFEFQCRCQSDSVGTSPIPVPASKGDRFDGNAKEGRCQHA
jgi:pSer/pThr/pTyr-binding forkhead associated (FHA) protein